MNKYQVWRDFARSSERHTTTATSVSSRFKAQRPVSDKLNPSKKIGDYLTTNKYIRVNECQGFHTSYEAEGACGDALKIW